MTPFDNIVGRTILSIIRQDEKPDYAFASPLGIYFRTYDYEGIYFGILSDGNSVNIEIMNDEELQEMSGAEYSETSLNELRTDDELNLLVGEQITSIELAEYKTEKLEGDGFVIKQGKYAGMCMRTTSNELIFFNEFGGQLWINMD